jgi:cysteine desulfurase/selenocysteine lyase
LQTQRPFLYGGDMIADGQVTPERVAYNVLPWKFSAGTPNILGTIVSAQAIRLLLDFALHGGEHRYFRSGLTLERAHIRQAMSRITTYTQQLTHRALDMLRCVPGITLYGPRDARRRTPLVSFNLAGRNPMDVAEALNAAGVESRAGCHCATLAHHALKLDPPASCRLSFYLYNTLAEIDFATATVRAIATA